MPTPRRHGRERAESLQTRYVHAESEVPIAHLQGRGGRARMTARVEGSDYRFPVDSTMVRDGHRGGAKTEQSQVLNIEEIHCSLLCLLRCIIM